MGAGVVWAAAGAIAKKVAKARPAREVRETKDIWDERCSLIKLPQADILKRMRLLVISVLFGLGALAQTTPPQQLFKEAVEAQRKGDDATAISKYQELVKLSPDVVEVRANLGAVAGPSGQV